MKNIVLLLFFISSFTLTSQELESKEKLQKNNVKKYFYKDNLTSRELWFGDDKKIDSLKTFYPNGNKNEKIYFEKGKYQGKSYQYNKYGEKIVTWIFKKGKLLERIDHNYETHKNNEERIINAHVALEQAKATLKKQPQNLVAYYKLTQSRYTLGNTSLALDGFKKLEKRIEVLKKTNKYIPAKKEAAIYDALGSIYANYEMENTAIHYKLKAINTAPEESRLYNNFGGYLTKNENYHLAQFYFNKAIEIKPKHSFANWGLANTYTDIELYEKGMECINIAFENQESIHKLNNGKSERDLHTTRGYLHHKLGESQKGISDLTEALEINENNTYALRYLGEIYYDLELFEKSCEALQKAKSLGYEKIHDKTDLDYFLNYSCNQITSTKPLSYNELPYAFPNPARNAVTIVNIDIENFNYKVYNYNSQLMLEGNAIGKAINFSTLKAGLYILKITQNGKIHSLKIIKE